MYILGDTNIRTIADIQLIQVRKKEALIQRFLACDKVAPGEGLSLVFESFCVKCCVHGHFLKNRTQRDP